MPAHLKGEAHLVLQYGNDLPIPITDLVVDDSGVRATLSFSRTPHRTVVPWSAVYVIATDDGRGMLYHEDIPSDVAVVASKPDAETAGVAGAPPPEGGAEAEAEMDVAASLDDGAAGGEAFGSAVVAKSPRRTLRSIPLDGASAPPEPLVELPPEAALAGAAPAVRRRRKPQLRLVK